jgi:multiple sugar transport system substrate-binding protein
MYRKDIFQEYGISVPKTMDDMMEAAKLVVQKSNGDMAGVTFRGQSGVHVISTWGTFLWAFGGHWLTNAGKKLDLNTPEAIRGTKYEADILNKYGPPGYANFGWQENRVNFTQGKSAMTIDATVNGAYNEDPSSSAIVGKVGYAPIPVVPGVQPKGNPYSLFVHSFYMNSNSKHKEATFLFMSWATSAAMQIETFGLKPNSGVTSLAAMNSDAYKTKYGAFLSGLLAALKLGNADYYPLIPQANEIALKVGVAVSQVFAGQKTAEQALKEVNDEVNTTILR